MSIEIARYQFHSWARKGISANITEGDDLGNGTSAMAERAEVPISVKLNGNATTKHFSLICPGDIIGINRDLIVRTEPLNWITDTEPNYLAFVEFYDEDFAWRYTPASPQGERLRPWIFLLVLKEDEFERTKRKIPLPTINIKNKEAFPPYNETWLWAHVHSNADIPDADLSIYEKFLLSLNTTVNDDPDQIYCRLMNPRKLEPNTAYYAFIVPAFETGRLAGLEQPTDGIIAQMPSWDGNGAKGEMPVYHEWFFRTGTNADFESLVKLLEPRAMDPKVGIRDMDCSKPGFVRADDTTKEIPGTQPPVIGLEGALKSRSTVSTKFPDPATAKEFQTELQKIVNLPATIAANLAEDPIVSVPLYGQNHAKKSINDVVMLDVAKNTWVHDLNKDPRTRVAAGFGTLVVQKNQESFMRKAWEQVTTIIEANRRIKATKLMMSVAMQYTQKTLNKLQKENLLAIANPVLKKVKGSPATIYHMIGESRLPAAIFSGAFRRMIRPNGPIAKRSGAEKKFNYTKLVADVNNGNITASPPKETPDGMFTTLNIANTIFPYRLPNWLLSLLRHSRAILLILFLLFILLATVTGGYMIFGAFAAVTAALYPIINRQRENADAAEIVLDNQKQLENIESVPPKPNFTLRLSDEQKTPLPTVTSPGQDSVEAMNFRTALIDMNRRLSVMVPEKIVTEFDVVNAYAKVSNAIHPHTSFPFRLLSLVKFPAYIPLAEPEKIFPAMAYPDFEEPMYKKLSDISNELLLPNLQLIPPNTISLLETNQKFFIEPYLVGLNHEMGRELLWREYPTDQRGSYFRQFWDVKGIIRPVEGKSEVELTEEFKDINPIHTWSINSMLGRHNKRDAGNDAEQLVLVIRGDLLKRYPNSVIFAQKAISAVNPNDEPVIDLELDESEFQTHVKFPLYKAEIAPDIKFFGFDLTIEQARGTETTPGFNDNLGWFFIIQEVPGEPRFGMDISFEQGSDGLSWNDLAWTNLPANTKFINTLTRPNITPTDASWAADSANMAYILFQKPSMVAVHAKEMLEKL